MKSNPFRGWLIGAGLVMASLGARAADIDLFANAQTSTANAPDVLFIIDTGASFSANNNSFFCNISASGTVTTSTTTADATALNKTNGGVEQCALYSVIGALATSTTTINVGIMMFNGGMTSYNPVSDAFSTPCTASGISGGGCLVMPMTPLNSATAPNIQNWIRQWNTSGGGNYNIKAPANRGDGSTMQEAWAYYFGKTGMSGRDYSAIAPAAGCASKNIVFLGNNWSTQASPKDPTSPTDVSPLNALKGLSSTIAKRATPTATLSEYTTVQAAASTVCSGPNATVTLDGSEGKGGSALNWAFYMKDQGASDSTKGVTTYAVALENLGCDANYGIWLPTLADKGGGEFFSANSYDSLVTSLKTALGNIASVNSVFAAVSLPVSVNTQGTYLNDIYVGMFRPAQSFLPQWNGNLKQYKLGLNSSGVLRLQDADGVAAINTQTGFLTECARSSWTPSVVDTYWLNQLAGGCLKVANSTASNFPDGNIVEKGAQAYKLRAMTPAARTVKTCSTSFAGCTSLTDFSTANSAVTSALGANLVDWARGSNLDGELGMATTVMRASAHGDVVHSRPIPINYGTDLAPSIVVYYGGNDGMFRAVNGNRESTALVSGNIVAGANTYLPGDELWSFVPPEFYGNFQRLRDDKPAIGSAAMPSNVSTQKTYGIDGPITAFQGAISGSNKVYTYASMRRGGRAIYAFDVTTPGTPALLWKKGCPNASDDTSCSSGYTGLGQTWSSLKTMYATGYGSGTAPLLITGGGYDACEDFDALVAGGANHSCTSLSKGNKVYVIDAVTGAVVHTFDTERPVIADSTLVRDAATGKIRHAYTADMGGNVYRMTFGTGAETTWTIVKIASLGCNTASLTAVLTCTANRKFMFAPSVVTTDNDTFYVMLGSGDREKPVKYYTSATAVTNYFFMVKDTISNGAASYTDTANCGAGSVVLCLSSLFPITSATPTDTQLATKKGWYLALTSTEQVVTSAITIFGVVTFSTHQPAGPPPANSCVPNLGTTNVYNISYLNAGSANGTNSRFEHVAGDGLPPSPVAGQVTLDTGQTVPFCIGCSKDSPLEGAPPRTLSSVIQPKNRLYWFIQK